MDERAFQRSRNVRPVCAAGALGIGFLTSLSIDKVQAAAPEKPFRLNIVGNLWAQIGRMREDRALFLAVLNCWNDWWT